MFLKRVFLILSLLSLISLTVFGVSLYDHPLRVQLELHATQRLFQALRITPWPRSGLRIKWNQSRKPLMKYGQWCGEAIMDIR